MVDYVGIGHHLKKAIDTYDEREQKEVIDALSFPEEELRELEDSHAAIMALLEKHGLTDLTDHDAFFDVFYDEDLRFDFMLAFKKLTKCLNLVFPAKEALTSCRTTRRLDRDQRPGRKALSRRPPEHEGHPAQASCDHRRVSRVSRESTIKVEPISILDEDFREASRQREAYQDQGRRSRARDPAPPGRRS